VVLFACVFVLFPACLHASAASETEGLRWIETAPGQRTWMTESEVLALVKPGEKNNFLDVTDQPDLAPTSSQKKLRIPPNPKHQAIVDALLPELKVDQLRATISSLSTFFTRYYNSQTGKDAAEWLFDQYRRYGADNSNIDVTYFPHAGWLQPSLIIRLKGEGENADERVIIGGHIDSIAGAQANRAPGADDDASGSACVLEAFRVLVQNNFVPKRTLEFHGYAAEEAGLRGSQAIATAYQQQGIKVAGMLQLDMTSYVRAGAVPEMGLVQDFVNATLTRFVGQLIDTYTNIGWVPTTCGYACSDHASWTRAGYPSSFPFESRFGQHSPFIHTAQDTLSTLNLEHGIEFAKLGLAFAVELGLD